MATTNKNAAKPANTDTVKWVVGAIAAFSLLPGVGIFVAIFCLHKAFKAHAKASKANPTGQAPTLESVPTSVRNAVNETAGTMKEAVDTYQQSNPKQGARRAQTTKRRKPTPAPMKKPIPKPNTPIVEEGFRLFGRRPDV